MKIFFLMIFSLRGLSHSRQSNMLNWIKNIRSQTKSQDLKEKGVTVVLGNEACDLDSGVSAITLAYHLSTQDNQHLVLPMLNIPEKDYALKTELVHCLQKIDIRQEDLFFTDNLDLHSLGKLSLVIVDHNVLIPKYADLDQSVVEVLDHHALERKPREGTRMTVEKVGSCSTLVAEKIFSENPEFSDREALTVILETILIDTVMLSPDAKKVTDKDIAMVNKIESVIGQQDRKSMYDDVLAAKEKIDHLSPYQLLRRDLKSVQMEKVKISISAVPVLSSQFIKMKDAWKDVKTFSLEEQADCVMVEGYKIDQGTITRDLIVYSESSTDLFESLVRDLESQGNTGAVQLYKSTVPPLLCHGDTTQEKDVKLASYFKVGAAVSRKVLLPLVKQILTNILQQK